MFKEMRLKGLWRSYMAVKLSLRFSYREVLCLTLALIFSIILTACPSSDGDSSKNEDNDPKQSITDPYVIACIDVPEGTECSVETESGRCRYEATLEDDLKCVIGEENVDPMTEEVAGQMKGVIGIDANYNHVCAIVGIAGEVMCWGKNDRGQLGNGKKCEEYGATGECLPSDAREEFPAMVIKNGGGEIKNARSIATGAEHTCAVASDGRVWCWGRNDDGQLGDGNFGNDKSSVTAVLVSGVESAKQVAAGVNFNCALVGTDGKVMCWGDNEYGEIGNGKVVLDYEGGDVDSENAREPVAKYVLTEDGLEISGVAEIFAGPYGMCAVKNDANLACWGVLGGSGNLFLHKRETPFQTLSGVKHVAVGAGSNCAVKLDGKVHCWQSYEGAAGGQIGDLSEAFFIASPGYRCVVYGSDSKLGCSSKPTFNAENGLSKVSHVEFYGSKMLVVSGDDRALRSFDGFNPESSAVLLEDVVETETTE